MHVQTGKGLGSPTNLQQIDSILLLLDTVLHALIEPSFLLVHHDLAQILHGRIVRERERTETEGA